MMVNQQSVGVACKLAASVHVWIGLGANLGNAQETLSAALQALSAIPCMHALATSSFYRSAPVDAQGPDFINAVAHFQTTLNPDVLLQKMQTIEQQFGRERPYYHAPRTLDLDLLLYGDECIQTPMLTVPHPAMHERAFVLLPLAELDENMIIPQIGAVKTLLTHVKTQAIERITKASYKALEI